MPGVTEQEIAQAKQMNLYQYMQLCEPDNFKPEGPGQFRHKSLRQPNGQTEEKAIT
mgnify:CR=1 FL=1